VSNVSSGPGTIDLPAVLRRARAMRLRARGRRFLLQCSRERVQRLHEHAWAFEAVARLELHDRLEQLHAIRYACRVRRRVGD
jgi:hypothetical protein